MKPFNYKEEVEGMLHKYDNKKMTKDVLIDNLTHLNIGYLSNLQNDNIVEKTTNRIKKQVCDDCVDSVKWEI